MQPIPLEPGMRVRCVSPDELIGLYFGDEHVIFRTDFHSRTGKYRIWVDDGRRWFRADRFKPVVRVKAPCIPSLDVMIKRAKRWFDALSPAEQEAHMRAQRDSYVRGEMELSRLERDAGRTRHIFAAAH